MTPCSPGDTLGRCYAAGDPVPEVLFPCCSVSRVVFGADVEVVDGFPIRSHRRGVVPAIFPMTGKLVHAITVMMAEFPLEELEFMMPASAIVVYGCDEESLIGCSRDEFDLIARRQTVPAEIIHSVVFGFPRQLVPEWKQGKTMIQLPHRGFR